MAAPGDAIAEGDTIAILESMKMEIPLKATSAGVLVEWLVGEGTPVAAGQHIAVFREADQDAETAAAALPQPLQAIQ
jgi:urea carboxylase